MTTMVSASNDQRGSRATLDTLGIMASTACAIHCIALPVVLALFPLLPLGGLQTPWVEWAFVASSLLIGIVSFRDVLEPGAPRVPIVLFLTGALALIAVRTLVGEDRPVVERAGLLVGAALIAGAHVRHAVDVRRRCACVVCEPPSDPLVDATS